MKIPAKLTFTANSVLRLNRRGGMGQILMDFPVKACGVALILRLFWDAVTMCDRINSLSKPVADCCRIVSPLINSKFKHKIFWKTTNISFNSLIECFCNYFIECGQIKIQHYFLSSYFKYYDMDYLLTHY